MKINKSKCWILHLRWKNPGYTYKLGGKRHRSSPTERDLRIWFGGKLSQQCPLAAKRANYFQEYIKHRITGWSRHAIVPLYTALGWPHLKSFVQFRAPQYKNIKLWSIFRGG